MSYFITVEYSTIDLDASGVDYDLEVTADSSGNVTFSGEVSLEHSEFEITHENAMSLVAEMQHHEVYSTIIDNGFIPPHSGVRSVQDLVGKARDNGYTLEDILREWLS